MDDKMRGKGVATEIYNAVEKFAREKDFKGVSLNTFNEWKDNLRLVLKLGYKIYDLDKSGENEEEPKIMLKKSF